jgi:hypothetical protein
MAQRQPNRTPIEKLEDTFADLSIEEQVRELEELQKLHRWCKRERSRASEPQTTLPLEGNRNGTANE